MLRSPLACRSSGLSCSSVIVRWAGTPVCRTEMVKFTTCNSFEYLSVFILIAGKLHLQGTIAQKFDQLDKRETELLEDSEKQRVMVKRLKDDRAHYRKKCEDKE